MDYQFVYTDINRNIPATCTELIILGNLELPSMFLYNDTHVEKIDMSQCYITEIPEQFCHSSNVKEIIWSPGITVIRANCLCNNKKIRRVDISGCTNLTIIGDNCFAETNITEILLPSSIKIIRSCFAELTKNLLHLDVKECVNLAYIGSKFCFDAAIISGNTCTRRYITELDFRNCKNVRINPFELYVNTLKIYSIDNIIKNNSFVVCKNLFISKITETRYLDLDYIIGLENVYLPQGEYQIKCRQHGVKFWLGEYMYDSMHFVELKEHILPPKDMCLVDVKLDTV
jgi:hypothetical protein